MKNSEILLVFFLSLFVLGVYIKGVSFILLHGSIFEPLRRSINKSGIRLLKDLFDCPLCMTAQTAFWLAVLPLCVVLFLSDHHFLVNLFDLSLDIYEEVFLNIFAIFLYSITIGTIAKYIWDLSEYLPKKLKLAEEYNKEKLRIKMMSTDSSVTSDLNLEIFKFEDFSELIERLENRCSHIGCGVSRKDCREEELSKFLHQWYEENNVNNTHLFIDLQNRVEGALKRYFSSVDRSEQFKIFLHKNITVG